MSMTYKYSIIKNSQKIDNKILDMIFQKIVNGHYLEKQFFVLPYIHKQLSISGKTVLFPHLTQRELVLVNKGDEIEVQKPEERSDQISKYLEKNLGSFFSNLRLLFDEKDLRKIQEFDIYVVTFGPKAFTIFKDEEVFERNTIVLRHDFKFPNILSQLLEIVLVNKFGKSVLNNERNIVRDFIKQTPTVAKYFKSSLGMMQKILSEYDQQGKYIIESKEFVDYLSSKIKSIKLGKNDNVLVFNEKLNLGEKEHRLLRILLLNKGKLVQYDAIYDYVWLDAEFSLWKISKMIERIKKKVKLSGIAKNIIISVKGKGYILKV